MKIRLADLPSILNLTRLDIEIRWLIVPYLLPEFVDLHGFLNLQDLSLTTTRPGRIFGIGLCLDTNIFQGYSSSLRNVSVQG
jgi:hypothetical protein